MSLLSFLRRHLPGPAPVRDAGREAGPEDVAPVVLPTESLNNDALLAELMGAGTCETCIRLKRELATAIAERDACKLEMQLMAGILERLKQHELELTAMSVARQEMLKPTAPRSG